MGTLDEESVLAKIDRPALLVRYANFCETLSFESGVQGDVLFPKCQREVLKVCQSTIGCARACRRAE